MESDDPADGKILEGIERFSGKGYEEEGKVQVDFCNTVPLCPENTGKKEETMAEIIKQDVFSEKVLNAAGPVLVDFYADWCGPCKMMAPVIEEIAGEVNDVKVGKLNIDNELEIAQKYGVMSIPTLIVFKNGEEVKRDLGAKPKRAVLDMLK